MVLLVVAESIFIISLSLLYLFLKSRYRYWEVRNIPYLKPNLIFGNAYELCIGKKSMLEFQKDIYFCTKENKLLGIYMFQKPTLYVSDVEWIKSILIEDFSYFRDRGLEFDSKTEPLTRHLFHIEGQFWKSLRSKISPSFTPRGLKVFFSSIITSIEKLEIYFSNYISNKKDINLHEVMGRYATDVIGRCTLSINSNVLDNNNCELHKMSVKIFSPRLRTLIKLILPKLPNILVQIFDIKMIETAVSQYFTQIIKTEIKLRSENGEKREDFLNYLLNIRNNEADKGTKEIILTDELVIAQCFMFYIAGYENSSSALCSALFELSRNPDIQEKLYDEVHHCFKNKTFNITFEELQELNYLEMFVCEVIRLYPPATALIRECQKDYNLPGSNIIIEKGMQIVIPVCGLHTDPQYFPYADTFNPENFSSEAKLYRHKCAYLPFGDGPRSCLGKKFGIMLIKMALIMFISSYKFYPSMKMHLPVTFEKKCFVTNIENDVWIRYERRAI